MDRKPPLHSPFAFRAGFSFVELLVALALLAVLAAVLLPVTRRVFEERKRVECVNVLRSLGTVTHLYVSEHDGYLFRMRAQDPVGPADYSKNPWSYPGGKLDPDWGGKRDAYQRLFITELHRGCPANREQTDSAGSYSANREVVIGAGTTARKLSGVERPGQTLLVAEAGQKQWMNDGFNAEKRFLEMMGTHHGGKLNLLWLDGHVSTWERSALLNPGGTAIDGKWLGLP